jgi:hypothetical protein
MPIAGVRQRGFTRPATGSTGGTLGLRGVPRQRWMVFFNVHFDYFHGS